MVSIICLALFAGGAAFFVLFMIGIFVAGPIMAAIDLGAEVIFVTLVACSMAAIAMAVIVARDLYRKESAKDAAIDQQQEANRQ